MEATERSEPPMLTLSGGWETVLEGEARRTLEASTLAPFLRVQRWFGAKAKPIAQVRIADVGPLAAPPATAFLVLLNVEYMDGSRDRYFVPLAVMAGDAAVMAGDAAIPAAAVVARLTGPQGTGVLCDGLADESVCRTLLAAAGSGREFPMQQGRIRAAATSAYAQLRGEATLPVLRGPATSSNSLVFFGERLLLKLFRRLEPGINPDYEIGRFLTEHSEFRQIPQVAGSFQYDGNDGTSLTLGLLQQRVLNQGDGWEHALKELRTYLSQANPSQAKPTAEQPNIGSYLDAAATLGRRTAQMHAALADGRSNPNFALEPLTQTDVAWLRQEIDTQAQTALTALAYHIDRLPPTVLESARWLLGEGRAALQAVGEQIDQRQTATMQLMKSRIHGDYHLGQVLWVDGDYVILDFEGEPTRTVQERREKFSPIRDVAGMLRSYHYAAYAALFEVTADRPDEFARLLPPAEHWRSAVSDAFLEAYRQTAGEAAFLPSNPEQFASMLQAFMLAKALYELTYELNNRPDWVRIPLGGVLGLLRPDA